MVCVWGGGGGFECSLCKHLVDRVCLQYYLKKYIPKHNCILLTKLRLSAHSVAIEIGRYINTERSDRISIIVI